MADLVHDDFLQQRSDEFFRYAVEELLVILRRAGLGIGGFVGFLLLGVFICVFIAVISAVVAAVVGWLVRVVI